MNETLISAMELHHIVDDPNIKIIDCRFRFNSHKKGYQSFLMGHIPNAWYAHLRDDLAGPIEERTNHLLLPSPENFRRLLQSLGISPRSIIIVYDDNMNLYASRFWWLAKCYGHKEVYILDGGLQAYMEEYPLSRGIIPTTQSFYPLRSFNRLTYCSREYLKHALDDNAITLIDTRNREQFYETKEPIDEIIEHFKGTINIPYQTQLDKNGYFLPKKQLIQNFTNIIARDRPIVFYGGSDVSATHSFLALSLTGLHETASIYSDS